MAADVNVTEPGLLPLFLFFEPFVQADAFEPLAVGDERDIALGQAVDSRTRPVRALNADVHLAPARALADAAERRPAAGIRAIWLNRSNSAPPDCDRPEATVASLTGLTGVLNRV